MSNSKFIARINEEIAPILEPFTGSRLKGIAQSMIVMKGVEAQLLPALVDLEGEGDYIGLDDKAPVTIYHKANSITVTEKNASGYGDSKSDKVDTYNNSMIVFMDRKATKLLPDEFILLLQANISDTLKFPNYKSVIVRMQNIVLNSQQVFASEYQNNDYQIPPRFSLFAINYQIESTFDKNCFAKCP